MTSLRGVFIRTESDQEGRELNHNKKAIVTLMQELRLKQKSPAHLLRLVHKARDVFVRMATVDSWQPDIPKGAAFRFLKGCGDTSSLKGTTEYKQLLEMCAGPDLNACVVLNASRNTDFGAFVAAVVVDPSKPFSASADAHMAQKGAAPQMNK